MKNELVEKVSTIDLGRLPQSLQLLHDYKIFPSSIMVSLTQWKYEDRKMAVGHMYYGSKFGVRP